MAIAIHIPTPLRPFTENKDTILIEQAPTTVGEALEQLVRLHGGVRKYLFADDGSLRNFVNVYVNNEDIRYAGGASAPISGNDSISIIPSIAGGLT